MNPSEDEPPQQPIRTPTVLLVVQLLLMLLAVACSEPPQPPPDFEQYRRQEPLNESHGVTYLYTERGHLRARLKAPYVAEYFVEDTEEIYSLVDRGLTLEFFNAAGEVDSRLTAHRARIYDERGYAEAEGQVVLVTSEGNRLETEVLRWRRRDDLIHTDAFVQITTDRELIFGDSLEASPGLEKYTIYKIRGTMLVDEAGG